MQQRRKESVVNFEGGMWNQMWNDCWISEQDLFWLTGWERAVVLVEEFKECEKEEMLSGLTSWRRRERKWQLNTYPGRLVLLLLLPDRSHLHTFIISDPTYHTREMMELEKWKIVKTQDMEKITTGFKGDVENLSVPFPYQHYPFPSLHFLVQWNLTPLLAQL